jgi:hypothetical protein
LHVVPEKATTSDASSSTVFLDLAAEPWWSTAAYVAENGRRMVPSATGVNLASNR